MAKHLGRQCTNDIRESYLGIYNYIQGCRKLTSRKGCISSRRGSIHTRAVSTTISNRQTSPSPSHIHTTSTSSDGCVSQFKKWSQIPSDGTSWLDLENIVQSKSSCERVEICGYVTSQRQAGSVVFVQLVDPALKRAVQLIVPSSKGSRSNGPDTSPPATTQDLIAEPASILRLLRPHTPVSISGRAVHRNSPPKSSQRIPEGQDRINPPFHSNNVKPFVVTDPYVGTVDLIQDIEIQVDSIKLLNEFPADLIAQVETSFGPERRNLQLRVDQPLRHRLRLRSQMIVAASQYLLGKDFDMIETPLLFKSTPEGAREFIVPTRKRGMAYALPQSPQQYKQMLMASGFSRYFQFARCFRDEDLRADRQPEFTQLDMEMAFAGSKDVMMAIERLLLESIWPSIRSDVPYKVDQTSDRTIILPQMTYQEAMSSYGSDKPDTRIGAKIMRVDDWLPKTLTQMLTSLEDPITEIFKIDMDGQTGSTSAKFVANFLDSTNAIPYVQNPDGAPGVFIYDPTKPLRGLSSFGHEYADKVEELFDPQPGDILVAQCRSRAPFAGGSTMLGNLRRDIHHLAISQGLIPAPTGHSLFWIVDFPLFSPINENDPGQGGLAGICATHHPFTAPKADQDLSKIRTDPLSVIGDHYDLVINGVEIGGGSRRIHSREMQEFIFSDILQMEPSRIEGFRHLLNALDAGCPPHAGFALGLDRLVALLTDRSSVRDVIAFPKWADGEDKFVGSPSLISKENLQTYHLAFSKSDTNTTMEAEKKISIKA